MSSQKQKTVVVSAEVLMKFDDRRSFSHLKRKLREQLMVESVETGTYGFSSMELIKKTIRIKEDAAMEATQGKAKKQMSPGRQPGRGYGYLIASHSKYSVVRAKDRKAAYSAAVVEFGRGQTTECRRASMREVDRYLAESGKTKLDDV